MANIFIGTSGWVYSDWSFDYAQDKLNYFYPPKLPKRKWLGYYSGYFKTVEINATFYHQMKPTTFANWFVSTPDDFVFAVKASRFITHIKRLNDVGDSMNRFIRPAMELGTKLGPILFQFPPRFKGDAKRLEAFLVFCSQLTLRLPSIELRTSRSGRAVDSQEKTVNRELIAVNRLAFEFRDPSWFDESIYKILKKHNCALVIAESGDHWPSDEVITANFTYIRFHGEGGSYASKYTDGELKIWAKKIKKWQRDGVDVYAYFNNDINAYAVENARTLISMLGSK